MAQSFAKRYQPFPEGDGLFTGEDISLFFPVYDEDGDLLDPSAWTTTFKVGPSQGAANVLSVGGTEAADGITVPLTAANMTTIGAGEHWYELARTDAGNARVIAYGEFVVGARVS
jgi:hypothetical protein